MPTYLFYITTVDGERTEWRGLTKREACAMYKYTDKRQPHNVKSYGWKEVQA